MAPNDIICLHTLRNSNDLGSNNICVNSGAKDIGNVFGKAVDHIEDGVFTMENFGQPKGNQCAHSAGTDISEDPSAQSPMHKLAESVSVSEFPEKDNSQCLRNGDDSGHSAYINGSVDRNKVGIHEKLGVKRLQEEYNNESTVCIVFNSLPSRSKRKLEELLSNWSDWHAKHCASAVDPADTPESGEETYFPALNVGSDKTSTVSFSMDVPLSKRHRKESVSLNQDCSPLYDRGFAVGLVSDAVASEQSGVDLREASRCFNCGSYNHPLSGCMKPIDKAAVNSARKEFQSKRNQNSNPRVLTRYYLDSSGGRFDGLIPGALSAETRKLMGLGVLDPPPWLNRMRELGYPPGYLDPEKEDQPSGITIFGDGEAQNIDVRNDPSLNLSKSQNKVLIEFPGINAPIPKNADHSLWASSRGRDHPDFSSNQPNNRQNCGQDSTAIRNFHGAYGMRNYIAGLSPPFGFGSPPVSQQPYNYYASEPFSPIGIPIPVNRRYERPFMDHYKHGSF